MPPWEQYMNEPADAARFVDAAAARASAAGAGGAADSDPSASAPVPEPMDLTTIEAHLDVAQRHRSAGAELPADTPKRNLMRVLVKASTPVVNYQRVFNDHVLAAISALIPLIDQRATALEAMVTSAELGNEETARQVATAVRDLAEGTDAVRGELGLLRNEMASLRSEIAVQRARHDALARAARASLPEHFDEPGLTALARQLDDSYEALYRDLENVFRGTREQVRAFVADYVADMKTIAHLGPVVDLGCGRCEWLELLAEAGIDAHGVDSNTAFVEAGAERGLDVRQGDAIAHLRELPEASLGGVTAFHLAEHLPLDALVALVDAALVALKPGGLLLLETPNPTNLRVGAAAFYIDPTHLKPLHPEFMKFLLDQRGFADTTIRYVHRRPDEDVQAADLATDDVERATTLAAEIDWALFGPPDYAAIARKAEAI
jgi:O-antigen chain-terminating methyltransferase